MSHQYACSTTPKKAPTTPDPAVMTAATPPPGPHVRTHRVTIKYMHPSGLIAIDQTDRFLVTTSRGHTYIMVAYVQDPNSILAEPIKPQSVAELLRTYNKIYSSLLNSGFKPTFQITDNKCPNSFQSFLKFNIIEQQLASPYDHRTNPTEKAIDTFRAHFVAKLASVDPIFPLHLWYILTPYAVLTLNLLRRSNVNPNISAYA